jgi:hypothetical protein
MSKIKFTELDANAKFLYVSLTQSALIFREMERSKEEFLDFAKEIWESMLLSNEKDLKQIISNIMTNDLKKFSEANM